MTATPPRLDELFYDMLRIRRVEERIESLYHLDEMKTPIHLCIGQEAVAVGVCRALGPADHIQSNHRGHGHYLARGGSLETMLAELYGRADGCAGGRGGSMHFIDPSHGNLGASAIVGGGIPIATGLGLAIRQTGGGRVSAVFFGDGAADEGVLYESVNFALLKGLPVLYVLEDNQWAVCSRRAARQDGDNVFLHLPTERLPSADVDGNDVEAVHAAARRLVGQARAESRPAFLCCRTYRLRGHAGSYSDAKQGHRTQAEIDEWAVRCPVERCRAVLRAAGALTPADEADRETRIAKEIDAAFAWARSRPFPDPKTVGARVYRQPL